MGNINRGTGLTLPLTSTTYINHANNGAYDNWYYGSSLYESLYNKQFNIRTGVPVPTPFGLETGTGIAAASWTSVSTMSGNNPA